MKPTKEEMLKWLDRRLLIQTFDVGDNEIFQAIRTLIEKVDEWQVTRDRFSEFCGELSTLNFSHKHPGEVVKWAEEKFSEMGIAIEPKKKIRIRDFGKEGK